MASKAFILTGLSLTLVLLVASEVSARDLAETSTKNVAEKANEDHKHVDGYGGGGHYGGGGGGPYGGGGGHYGGGGGQYGGGGGQYGGGGGHYGGGGGHGGGGGGHGGCRYGCCGYGCGRCCSYQGEAADEAAAGQP
ncbi:unnamed protein product [Cuscuta epithymum]|uniref:Glycine-rich protein n=1 Tax=Cuscuta epithymum TaxID=186058 RepID=A0AAV0G2S9_9ASTE|nr:unnamed protein product [Cuscuta epithymum]